MLMTICLWLIGNWRYGVAIVFFAFATWEVCGLGSTGRILHPEQAAQPVAHNIVVTQSSKLMLEFLLAWGLLLLSGAAARTTRT